MKNEQSFIYFKCLCYLLKVIISFVIVAVGGGLISLGLLGLVPPMLANAGRKASNRRSSYDDPYYYDRQDAISQGNVLYANNVKNFEDQYFRAAARNALRGMRNMKHSTRRLGKALRNSARAVGHNTVQGIHAMARSTGRMAKRYVKYHSCFNPAFYFMTIFM